MTVTGKKAQAAELEEQYHVLVLSQTVSGKVVKSYKLFNLLICKIEGLLLWRSNKVTKVKIPFKTTKWHTDIYYVIMMMPEYLVEGNTRSPSIFKR